MKHIPHRATTFKHPVLALSLAAALAATSASAQTTFEVAGDGLIGVQTLTTSGGIAQVPTIASASWSVNGDQGGQDAVSSSLVSPAASVPSTGNVILTFSHRYNFEAGWDGGAVLVSVDGAPAAYLDGSSFTSNGYVGDTRAASNGVSDSSAWSGGESVFYGESTGYAASAMITSVADLGVLNAGQTVSIEFKGAWDEFTVEGPPAWEVGAITLADGSASNFLDVNFSDDGPSSFTVANAGTVAEPWTFTQTPLVSRFEIDADTLNADQYKPDVAGSEIQLNGATLEVEVLTGTLAAGQSFTIFDLSSGTTLTGSVGSFSAPGVWDLSQLTVDGSITCLAPPPLLEELFEYPAGSLHNKDGGSGFAGPWVRTQRDPQVTAAMNRWGALATSGNRLNSQAWSACRRPIGTSLSDAGLMNDGATLWFSYVMDILGQNLTNLDYNFALCSDQFVTDYPDRTNLLTGEGIGFSNLTAGRIRAAYWQNNDADTIAEKSLSPGGLTLDAGANSRVLIVGKIEWGATAGDPEKLTLYTPGPDLALGTPIVDAWETPALNQSLFDTLSMEWKDSNPSIDEIRFGASSEVVLPPDVTPPSALVYEPADEADGAPSSNVLVFPDLSITFDEPVQAGTGFITIVETGGETFEAYDVETSTNLIFDGDVVTIDPTTDLATSTAYHIVVDPTAITDIGGNAFAGVSGTVDPNWNFTTNADGMPPTITTLSPADGDTGVATDGNLVATFSEPIAAGLGNITILNLTEGTQTVIPAGDAQVTISGADLTINPAVDLEPFDEYAVQLDTGVITDILGNPFAGIVDPDVVTWNFQTLPDTTAPVVDTLSPADDSTDVSPFGSLVITFTDQEAIQIGSGNIVIYDSGATALQTIDVTGSNVALTGPKEATISYALPGSTAVYVNIDAGAFADLTGNPFGGISGDTAWNFNTAAIAPAGPGSLTIFTATDAGEAVTINDLVHTFDGAPRLGSSHTPLVNGSDITMSAGHHLVIYNSRFDTSGGGNRSEIQTNLNLDGTDLAAGWSQGYIRRDSGQDETITAGGAIIDVASANGILQLQSFRTDTNASGVIREPGNTGIQMLKLDDAWDYLSLAGHDGIGTDQPIPSDTNWHAVEYAQEIENDTGSFAYLLGTGVTLVRQGHYLIFANTYGEAAGNRSTMVQRLILDGTEVNGSTTSVYLRSSDGAQAGATTIGMIIETTAPNQVLNVEVRQGGPDGTATIYGERTGLTMVKLPDSADYIRLEDLSADQDINIAGALNYDDLGSQLEVDSAFTHSVTVDPNRIGVAATADYLFLASQFDLENAGARTFYNQSWQVNGAGDLAAYGQTGRYGRDANGGDEEVGNWSGFITGLAASDYVETLSGPLGNGGSVIADVLALQGVSISSLFSDTPSNGFGDWITGFGLDAADQEATDDPDGDDLDNLLEALLGTDPSVANVAGISAPSWDGADFVFTHPNQDPPLDDVTATYQWSLDAQAWNASGDTADGTTVTVGAPAASGTTTVTATVTGTTPTKLFVRIVATQG